MILLGAMIVILPRTPGSIIKFFPVSSEIALITSVISTFGKSKDSIVSGKFSVLMSSTLAPANFCFWALLKLAPFFKVAGEFKLLLFVLPIRKAAAFEGVVPEPPGTGVSISPKSGGGGGGVGFQEVPVGAVNGSNANFTLSKIPSDDNSVIIYVEEYIQIKM